MTKPNDSKLSQQTLKKSNWPIWFPYPSVWLRTIILVIIALPGTKLIISGFLGTLISINTKSPLFLLFSLMFGILIPTIFLSFIYHIFWFIWQDKSSYKKLRKWIPNSQSLWEGFYATLVIGLSFSFILLISSGLSFAYCQSYQETSIDWARCTGRMTGRGGKIMIGTIENNDFINKPWFAIWMIISLYLYQAEYIFKKRFLPKLKSNFFKKTNRKNTNFINFVHTAVDKLRVGIGFRKINNKEKSASSCPASKDLPLTDNFQQAVNLSKNAAQLTRIAQTKSEWYQVGVELQKTIDMMKTVPEFSPNYTMAQQKIIDYQKFLDYAQKIVNSKN
jgi:hypothetical protein